MLQNIEIRHLNPQAQTDSYYLQNREVQLPASISVGITLALLTVIVKITAKRAKRTSCKTNFSKI